MATKVIAKRVPEWYGELVSDLKKLAFEGIVKTKHAIGQRIIQDELKFNKPAYGSKRIENLAKDLDISSCDLWRCVQFAKKYPELSHAVRELSWRKIIKLLPAPKTKDAPTPPLPKGKYNVIYADPPWQYADQQDTHKLGGAIKHYPLMTIEQICDMPVRNCFAADAVLFLWVTSPILEECFDVIAAWGFKYKASFVWDKIKHNMGHYNSVRHEFLLICTSGSMIPENKKLYDSVQSIERTKHSEKPTEFRKIIETLYPQGKKLELFARKEHKGWESYGNEL